MGLTSRACLASWLIERRRIGSVVGFRVTAAAHLRKSALQLAEVGGGFLFFGEAYFVIFGPFFFYALRLSSSAGGMRARSAEVHLACTRAAATPKGPGWREAVLLLRVGRRSRNPKPHSSQRAYVPSAASTALTVLDPVSSFSSASTLARPTRLPHRHHCTGEDAAASNPGTTTCWVKGTTHLRTLLTAAGWVQGGQFASSRVQGIATVHPK